MIRLENIVKRYRTRAGAHTVLNGVSVEVRKGDKLGVLGRNGAGKSTLIASSAARSSPTAVA